MMDASELALLILRDMVFCFAAAALYSTLMRSPVSSIPPSAVTAAVGYTIYDVVYRNFGQELLGYFLGTLLIAAAAEILARIMRMPATVFIFPGIIPLVPGIGLYQTMLCLVRSEYEQAASSGTKTLFIAGTMALAIAAVNTTARIIKGVLKKSKPLKSK